MNMIQKRQQMRGQSGFTLIELLVAIAILGILAGVAVFAVGNLTTDSKESACKTERETLVTAIVASATSTDADTPADFAGAGKYFEAAEEGTAVNGATGDDIGKYKVARKGLTGTPATIPPAGEPELADCDNIPYT
jgi:prepilin-type N-terminal cleavage/methylation domain-containing protein